MNEKKRTAGIAGLLAAAALVGAIAGPGVQEAPDRTLPPVAIVDTAQANTDAIGVLQAAVSRLVSKSRERGMDLEDNGTGTTPGINGVIDGMDGMAPTAGTTREVKVSKEGTLFERDKIRVCREFTAGEQLRFATGDVRIIATARSTVGARGDNPIDQTSRIAILFSQNGETKLKTVDMGEPTSMGTTVTILDDEALQYASLAMDFHNRCYVAYNRDGDGVITAVHLGQNRVNTVLWSDMWMDGGDPENICLAVDPSYGEAAVCCTRLPAGSAQDYDREAVLLDMALPHDGTGITDLGNEIVLTAAAQPSLYGIDYSKDAYAKGWDMEYVHFWYDEPVEDLRCNTIFITYPTSDEYRRGIIHLRRVHSDVGDAGPIGPSQPLGYEMSQVYGSLPCADIARVCTGDGLGHIAGVVMASGVTKLFQENGYSRTKSRVELELYTVTKDFEKPFCVLWRVSDNLYGSNISNVSVGHMGHGGAFFSFARSNVVYAGIVDFRHDGSVQGPLVNVGAFRYFAGVEMVDDDRAVLIYDTTAGDGYIRVLDAGRVIAETDGVHYDGTILEGGTTGQTVRADITYWPDTEEPSE